MSAAEALAQRPASPASGASTRDSHATAAAPTAPAGEKGEQLYVPPVKDEEPKTAFRRFTHRLSNLPEWPISKDGKISGRALNLAIGVACSSGFLAFGVMSGLLTLDDFQRAIPLMTPFTPSNALCQEPGMCLGTEAIQANGVAVYQIGCRRSSVFWGLAVMIIGTIPQVALGGSPATSYGLFCAGRVVGGGNGDVLRLTRAQSTIPTWQSECAKPHQRGFLIILAGALIAGGIAISYWIGYAFFFLEGSIRWRFPLAFQIVFCLFVMVAVLFLPDSPRWLMMRGRREEARDVIARLSDAPLDSSEVALEMRNIEETLHVQMAGGGFKFRELLDRGPSRNLQRTTIAVAAQFGQQIGGINLVTYYLSTLLENSLGFEQEMSRLLAGVNGTEYFLAGCLALPLIERLGRRKLLLTGAIGCSICMAVIAGCVSTGIIDAEGAPVLAPAPGITAVTFIFLFNTFFGVSWLGLTWLYPAEVTNLRTRIQANALATLMNWLINWLIVMISPPMLAALTYRTYIVFAVTNAALVPMVYFFFPETKSRSLEELDVMFAQAHALDIWTVKHSLEMPRLVGEDLEHEARKYFGDGAVREKSPAQPTAPEQQA
ncbi:hypothetical protein FA09DRAFT_347673 [Tilletiopsis washingtonensis]|uniref:Major facilitator superfamily (MFS) profile domain-containing protein n=1 Tax=Tilletiopsis washingtonensis TaxID=58919 RepID=A0A316ZHI8_9BASI|nr:hypothetical protein FA09DRAFT_347673 [Tilletiopsis washingtonensis]PWO01221.1 hypothetical protein FA09DRAFT_347673 [Tilletiopsis washingtonensis]